MAPTDPQPEPPPDRPARSPYASAWLAGVFLLGLVVGGVLIAVVRSGDDKAAAPRPGSRVTMTATRPADDGPASSGADVHVNADCVRAIEDARRALALLGDAGDAVGHLDLGALGSVVTRAKAIEQRLRAELPGCDASVHLPSGAPPS